MSAATASVPDDAAPTARRARQPPAGVKVSKKGYWQRFFALHSLSIDVTAILAITFVFLLHLAALTLFTKGFLLSRTTLEKRNTCDLESADCTLPAKFDRAVILLIDALRYDFLFPVDPASPAFDAAHHNQLTLPAELAKRSPTHSLLFKGIADPPTTTLQRLKAITTGSLPTFIDAGSNFAGSAVDEDNWLEQANRAGKRIVFMGDDTWLTIFPESVFAPNLSFPFDSFNVEDLDTVDAGVNEHIIPFLEEPAAHSQWDMLLAHPLGLDHAGHRFGASHAETTRKLREMNALIQKIVDRLDEKDLLVVLGDHGMDAKGDHGGDSSEETDAGLWFYSKTALVPEDYLSKKPFTSDSATIKDLFTHHDDFFELDGANYRSVNQISLIPTLSLLLGYAIPLNNLGTVIPELFVESSSKSWLAKASIEAGSRLVQAMRINAAQIRDYVEEYTSHGSGSDLAPSRPELLGLHKTAQEARTSREIYDACRLFTSITLHRTRAIWARFDPISMGAGLLLLTGSLAVLMRLFVLSRREGCLWKTGDVRMALSKGLIGGLVGLAVGTFAAVSQVVFDLYFLPASRLIILSMAVCAQMGAVFHRSNRAVLTQEKTRPKRIDSIVTTLIVFLHLASFASNSFTMWEDLIMLFMVQLPPLALLFRACRSPDARLRKRIAGFSILYMVINRLIGMSTICREEQHPYCSATFYGSSGTSVASASAVRAAILVAFLLPSFIEYFLEKSKANQGWAPFLLRYTYRAVFTGCTLYWTADYFEHAGPGKYVEALRIFKTTLARSVLLSGILLATTVWHSAPLCIQVLQKEVTNSAGEKSTQVTIIGWANAIGSSYLLLFLAITAPIFLLAQPVGQIVYSLGIVGLLGYLEAADSSRDADFLRAKSEAENSNAAAVTPVLAAPSSLSICSVVLLGFHLFFTTGHQAVLSAIQWKVAFVGFPTLTYPFSPLLVILNTLGPFILSAAAIPLLVFWNVPPTLKNGPTAPFLTHLVSASFGFLAYHTAVTLSSAIFSSHLRRHLMVWKVFAPRFMLSAITLLAVDVTILVVSIGWGGLGTLRKLQKTIGTVWS